MYKMRQSEAWPIIGNENAVLNIRALLDASFVEYEKFDGRRF